MIMITILIVMMVRPTWSNWSRRAARVECFAKQEESQESRQAAQGISFSSNHRYCDQFDQHCRHHYRRPHMNDDQDQCTWKSDLPTLLSVCLISMEPDTVYIIINVIIVVAIVIVIKPVIILASLPA